jgi:hypothetical protein
MIDKLVWCIWLDWTVVALMTTCAVFVASRYGPCDDAIAITLAEGLVGKQVLHCRVPSCLSNVRDSSTFDGYRCRHEDIDIRDLLPLTLLGHLPLKVVSLLRCLEGRWGTLLH